MIDVRIVFLKLDITQIKKIFSYSILSTKVFIKNQKSLLIKEEEDKYKHVPKILSSVLDRIVQIKNENKLPNSYIHSCFITLIKWTRTQEMRLMELKEQVNIGNYNFSHVSDLLILIELLFDWLESNIEYIINNKRISKFDKDIHRLSLI